MRTIGKANAAVLAAVFVLAMTTVSSLAASAFEIARADQISPAGQRWQLIATQRQRIPVWNARLMDDRELKVLTIQDCSQEPSLRSLNSQTPTFVRFTNATTQTVIVYWLTYEGSRDSSEDQKVTLQSGQSGVRSTYLTHPFLVTDVTGKCLGIYQPAREPSLAVIK